MFVILKKALAVKSFSLRVLLVFFSTRHVMAFTFLCLFAVNELCCFRILELFM